ncbi:group 1 truncated hemoglobin [Pannus brasiliensis CCIBt3594]|uniref:Group 1 truncated hemoglobin n=1 Tax=Pannus brasiliensis CCIBt3594 TaxID=1427578 RepID=A0AAW9QND5_9CHRO
MATLFEQLGGKDAVDLAVDKFYDRVLNDERINRFFVNVDMAKQRRHQKAFLTYVFGGSEGYDGRSLRNAHKRLVEEMGLQSEHFDAVIEDLVLTLQEIGVPDELIGRVGEIANTTETKKEVLNQ